MIRQLASKPSAVATRASSSRTLPWSPPNRVRKEAWVPVVPLAPTAAQPVAAVGHFLEVGQEVLEPEAGALAQRRQLS